MQVRDIMSHSFDSIAQDAAIRSAAQQMRDLDVGMLPVEQSAPTLRVYARRFTLGYLEKFGLLCECKARCFRGA